MHKCDNRACVRPDHLKIGTQIENMHDMTSKGRRAGRKHKRVYAKLTESQVLEVRSSTETHAGLARKFDVGVGAIVNIRKGKTWAKLK